MHHFASLQIAKGHNAHLAFIYSAYETRTAFYNALKDADKRNPDKLLKTFFEQGIASIAGSFVHLQIRWSYLLCRSQGRLGPADLQAYWSSRRAPEPIMDQRLIRHKLVKNLIQLGDSWGPCFCSIDLGEDSADDMVVPGGSLDAFCSAAVAEWLTKHDTNVSPGWGGGR